MIMWINLGILVCMFLVGYGIGRFKKQDVYERQIIELTADKLHWQAVAARQANKPPGL